MRFGAFWCASVRVIRIENRVFDLGLDGFEARLPLTRLPNLVSTAQCLATAEVDVGSGQPRNQRSHNPNNALPWAASCRSRASVPGPRSGPKASDCYPWVHHMWRRSTAVLPSTARCRHTLPEAPCASRLRRIHPLTPNARKFRRSGRYRLDDPEPISRHQPGHPKAGRCEQGTVLVRRALLTADQHSHVQVGHRCLERMR